MVPPSLLTAGNDTTAPVSNDHLFAPVKASRAKTFLSRRAPASFAAIAAQSSAYVSPTLRIFSTGPVPIPPSRLPRRAAVRCGHVTNLITFFFHRSVHKRDPDLCVTQSPRIRLPRLVTSGPSQCSFRAPAGLSRGLTELFMTLPVGALASHIAIPHLLTPSAP